MLNIFVVVRAILITYYRLAFFSINWAFRVWCVFFFLLFYYSLAFGDHEKSLCNGKFSIMKRRF